MSSWFWHRSSTTRWLAPRWGAPEARPLKNASTDAPPPPLLGPGRAAMESVPPVDRN